MLQQKEYLQRGKQNIRGRSEWLQEMAAAVILLGLILIGVHRGIFPVDKAMTGEGAGLKSGGTEEAADLPIRNEYQIEDFEIILQNPELPTGCEITAMTMALNYYGLEADKVDMAENYLPKAPAKLSRDSKGVLHGTDLTKYFLGDPATAHGYVCGTEAVRTAADKYLRKTGSLLRAVDQSGASVDELYRWVSMDIPVVVWVTINMEERKVVEGWYTENGEYVDWGSNDHGAVLIGYTEDTVTIADPISGKTEYSRASFERVFASRENQCVILQE